VNGDAYADPVLAECFPGCGPLRLQLRTDAIAGMLAAGEDRQVTADEHGCPLAAVDAVAEWMARWPGAWL
jgi:hypothetical protein